jgi:hypothetical protein
MASPTMLNQTMLNQMMLNQMIRALATDLLGLFNFSQFLSMTGVTRPPGNLGHAARNLCEPSRYLPPVGPDVKLCSRF